MNEKICRGFFQTLYWRRRFLAHYNSSSTSTSGFTGVGMSFFELELTPVPSIVVEESESASLGIPNPRFALPSLDLTHMRGNMGTGYSSDVSPTHIPAQDRSQGLHSPVSSPEDEIPSPIKTWSNRHIYRNFRIVFPIKTPQTNHRSQPMDETEANQVVQSLNQSVWGGAIQGSPSRSKHSRKGSDRSDGRD